MNQGYATPVTPTVTPRSLRPYETIVTPPIQLVFNYILDRCDVGGSIAPGVRRLADETGTSRGMITDYLRTLAADGWILYDGRNITLLRHPDMDSADEGDATDQPDGHVRSTDRSPLGPTDQPDGHVRSTDRSVSTQEPATKRLPLRAAIDRALTRQNGPASESDQPDGHVRPADRSAQSDSDPPLHPPMVIHDSSSSRSAAAHESPTMGGSGGAIAIDQPADQPTPAVQVMAELGADAAIIAAALAARPDYSPRQVQTLWAWCADRIARSEGRLGEGIFFHALRSGQLAPARAAPIDFTGYANDGLFRLGSDLANLEPVSTAPPTDESPHDRARALLPPWAGPRDYPLLVQLCAGLDDAAALAELARRRGRAA